MYVLPTHPDKARRSRDSAALNAFAEAEQAKRRLLVELFELKLPLVTREQDPDCGLVFDLLSSTSQSVSTGHHNGVITLDLAEGDDVYRERVRVKLAEPYRTLLGHFRHEVGHYYFYLLVAPLADLLQQFTALFGDSDTDYVEARDRYYNEGQKPVGSSGMCRPTRRCTQPRTGRNLRALSAHPQHPGYRGGLRICPANATYERKVLGPKGFRHDHRDAAPTGLVIEHGQPVDGKADLYPSCCPDPCWRRCVSSTRW